MFGIRKPKVHIWSATISLLFVLAACGDSSFESTEIYGETQGTTYNIIIVSEDVSLSRKEMDELFHEFDLSLSTYIDNSVISRINESTDFIYINDEHGYFAKCYKESQHIYQQTEGLFDPSVFPLVKGWGFMDNIESPLSQLQVDSLLNFVSFEKMKLHEVEFSEGEKHIRFKKSEPEFKLDFNAIAQGLSVDVVDRYLQTKGFTDYYIEIGGEIIVKGKNREGEQWKIGVDTPIENATTRELENVLHVSDKAIATSGNYRKFYVKDGVKYAHTLNPATGFPVGHSLLSATVIADQCSTADGYATAFMVMGVDATIEFVKNHPEEKLEVYLLFADENGEVKRRMSEGFETYLD